MAALQEDPVASPEGQRPSASRYRCTMTDVGAAGLPGEHLPAATSHLTAAFHQRLQTRAEPRRALSCLFIYVFITRFPFLLRIIRLLFSLTIMSSFESFCQTQLRSLFPFSFCSSSLLYSQSSQTSFPFQRRKNVPSECSFNVEKSICLVTSTNQITGSESGGQKRRRRRRRRRTGLLFQP